MKKTAIAAATFILLAAPVAAQEKPLRGPYIGAALGYVMPEDISVASGPDLGRDNGYRFSGAVGYDFLIARVEGEFGWQQTDMLNKDMIVSSGMANAYHDFRTGTAFTPFVGAGIGIAFVDFNNLDVPSAGRVDQSETGLAWQAMGGVSYALDSKSEIHLAYRYFNVGDVELRSAASVPLTLDNVPAHSFEIGTRVRF